MAALFGVAFLIVSISLGIQINKNTLNATSAEKVVALQDEIQQLKNENKELEDSVEAVLNSHEIFWNKSEVWIESEKLYEVLYQMTV